MKNEKQILKLLEEIIKKLQILPLVDPQHIIRTIEDCNRRHYISKYAMNFKKVIENTSPHNFIRKHRYIYTKATCEKILDDFLAHQSDCTKLNATLYFGKNPRILHVGGADIPFKVIETKK